MTSQLNTLPYLSLPRSGLLRQRCLRPRDALLLRMCFVLGSVVDDDGERFSWMGCVGETT